MIDRRRFLAATAALAATSLPAARPARADAGAATFAPEALREELAFLYAAMKEAHYDLFFNTARRDYDRAFRTARAAIDRPLTRTQAAVHFQRFLAVGRIAHARIDYPGETWEAFRNGGGKALPLEVLLDGARAVIARDLSPNPQTEANDEIIEINGEPVERWLARLRRNVSADTPYLTDAIASPRAHLLHWIEYGEQPAFDMRVMSGGELRRVRLEATDLKQREAADAVRPAPFSVPAWSREHRIEGGVAYLRPGPFLNFETPDQMFDPRGFIAFIDRAFTDFRAAGARRLLIDLRNNPGGDNSFSDPMIAWFADKPFRFCSSFRIRVSPQTTASNQARIDADPTMTDGVSARFARLYAGKRPGQIVDFAIPMAAPRPEAERFKGEVTLLVDRQSYSNTVTAAALCQDYGFARVMGEETADLASTHGAMEQFTLPLTGLPVGYPKAHIIRPNGDPTPRGVVPDHRLTIPTVRPPTDTVLEQALAVVTKA